MKFKIAKGLWRELRDQADVMTQSPRNDAMYNRGHALSLALGTKNYDDSSMDTDGQRLAQKGLEHALDYVADDSRGDEVHWGTQDAAKTLLAKVHKARRARERP